MWRNGRRAGFRTQSFKVRVQVPLLVVRRQRRYRLKVRIYWLKNYVFNSSLLPKVMHKFISGGNKESIEKEFYLYFKELKKITLKPVFLILNIIQITYPIIGLRSTKQKGIGTPGRKKGLVRVYIPFPIQKLRGLKMGLSWFKFSVLKQMDPDNSISFKERLLEETFAFYDNTMISNLLDIRDAYYEEVHDNRLATHFR